MPWQNEMTTILRILLNDLDPSMPTYSDERLQQVILVSAQLIQMDLDFLKTYAVDVEQLALSPDPTINGRDDGFINLTCYQAACIVDKGNYRNAAQNAGIVVTSDREKIDTTKILAGFQYLLDDGGWCNVFSTAKFQYKVDNQESGRAICGPMSSPNLYSFNFNGFVDMTNLSYPFNNNYSILSK